MSDRYEEKHADSAQVLDVTPELALDKTHNAIVDIAARAHIEEVEYSEAEGKSVLRKIDWHLMPMLVWICT